MAVNNIKPCSTSKRNYSFNAKIYYTFVYGLILTVHKILEK